MPAIFPRGPGRAAGLGARAQVAEGDIFRPRRAELSPRGLPESVRERPVRRRLDRWRDARTHPSPIPASLWAAAITAAERYGVQATADALRLHPARLKRRLEEAGRVGSAPTGPTFVELTPAPEAATPAACVIELTSPASQNRLR